MTEERFKYYMDLFECAEKLKNASVMEEDEYNYQCCTILEQLHQEYVKGDTLDRCY